MAQVIRVKFDNHSQYDRFHTTLLCTKEELNYPLRLRIILYQKSHFNAVKILFHLLTKRAGFIWYA